MSEEDDVLRQAQDDRALRQAQDDREEPMIRPGNNRRMQARRRGRRKLFGKKAKEAFLESFACTANVAASAAAIGFSEGVVFTHRRKDPEFRELYWVALEQATGKLAALRIQHEIERAERRGAASGGAGLEVRLDGPPDARQIADLVKLMQALRDLTRNLSGGEHKGGGGPRRASVDEVCAALAKRLKAFPPGDSLSDCPPSEAEDGDSQQVTASGEGPLHRPSDGPPPPDKLGEE